MTSTQASPPNRCCIGREGVLHEHHPPPRRKRRADLGYNVRLRQGAGSLLLEAPNAQPSVRSRPNREVPSARAGHKTHRTRLHVHALLAAAVFAYIAALAAAGWMEQRSWVLPVWALLIALLGWLLSLVATIFRDTHASQVPK